MKSVIANLGMLASVASAYSHPRHFHFARSNGTDAGQTTLTVLTTQVQTITSCAPAVTNCPANDKTALASIPASDLITAVVTNTVVLTEVVCPVSEAAEVSKSVISEAATGGITGTTLTAPLTASVPLSTGFSGPSVTSGSSPEATSVPGNDGQYSLSTTVSEYVTDKTVTLTLGIGSTASVVTSTIKSTLYSTVVVTCTSEEGSQVTGSSGEESTGEGSTTEEPTTTTTATSTGTITKTVQRASETKTASPDSDNGSSTGNSEGEGSCECPAVSTVTVTEAASTVYVTVGAEATGSSPSTDAPAASSTASADESDAEDDGEDADEDDEEECDAEDESTTVQATVTVVPFPANGTVPTSGYAAPTGFARFVR